MWYTLFRSLQVIPKDKAYQAYGFSMQDDHLRAAKEAFVTGHSGASKLEILCLTACMPLCIWLGKHADVHIKAAISTCFANM